MTEQDKPVFGRSIDDIVEAMPGGCEHRALLLTELGSAVEAACIEFAYNEDEPDAELVRMTRDLRDYLNKLSLTTGGALTFYRECARCSGDGMMTGEDPCQDCGGKCCIHADDVEDVARRRKEQIENFDDERVRRQP